MSEHSDDTEDSDTPAFLRRKVSGDDVQSRMMARADLASKLGPLQPNMRRKSYQVSKEDHPDASISTNRGGIQSSLVPSLSEDKKTGEEPTKKLELKDITTLSEN